MYVHVYDRNNCVALSKFGSNVVKVTFSECFKSLIKPIYLKFVMELTEKDVRFKSRQQV